MTEQDPLAKLREVVEKLVGDTLEAKRQNLQDGIKAYKTNLDVANNLIATAVSGIQRCEQLINKVSGDPTLSTTNPEYIPQLQEALKNLRKNLEEAKRERDDASTQIERFEEGIRAIDQMTGKNDVN